MDVICLLDLLLSNYLFLTIYLVSPVLSTIPHPSAAGGVDYFSDAYSFPSSGGPSSSYDSYSEDSKWQQELKDHSHIDQIRSRILRHNTLPHNRKMPVDVSVKLVFESVREIGVDATIGNISKLFLPQHTPHTLKYHIKKFSSAFDQMKLILRLPD